MRKDIADGRIFSGVKAKAVGLVDSTGYIEDAYDRLGGDEDWFDGPDVATLFKSFPRLMRTIGRAMRRGRLGKVEIREIIEILDDAMERIEQLVKQSKR